MSERAAVTVVGIGDDGWDGLTETARAALQQAPMIVGSTRQLGLLPDLGVRRQPLPSPLLSQLDDLVASNPGLCLLASGDPMLHGLGATLARRLGAGRLRVLPAVSSVALACARLGWAGHEVDVVSLVTRPVEVVLPAVQPGGRAIVLCRDGGTPAALARLLADRGWGDSELTVLEHLGGEAEQVTGPLRAAAMGDGRYADLAVVALVGVPGRDAVVLPRIPGLPDDAYESDGQLTKPRGPGAGPGARSPPGPGSCCGTSAPAAAASGSSGCGSTPAAAPSRSNAARTGPSGSAATPPPSASPTWRSSAATPPRRCRACPAPDAVFVGGGVTADGLLETCWERLAPGGRLVANAVTLESEAVLHRWQRAVGGRPGAAGRQPRRPARRVHRLAARPPGHPVAGDPAVTVYFIGAGPGAPDLLTVRAQRLLAEAPVCLYAGSLVPPEVLAATRPAARLVDTADLDLDAITAELVAAHATGHDVARLHSGDPSIFSAVAEQMRRLDEAGVP